MSCKNKDTFLRQNQSCEGLCDMQSIRDQSLSDSLVVFRIKIVNYANMTVFSIINQ